MSFVKKIYEGIFCFPDKNEFWNLYIDLMKEKDYFLDAFARETVILLTTNTLISLLMVKF